MKHEKKYPRATRAPNSSARGALDGERKRAASSPVASEDAEPSDTPGDIAGEFVDPEADALESSPEVEPTLVRLNKYLADHGIASRRKCDELIVGGQVTIDGDVTTELGRKIDPTRHTVEIDGFILKPQGLRRRYYLLNKPSGVVCTNEPRETRPRAVDLITDARKGRIYTVGRLDEESKGLILLTNDGDFANRIMHPRYGVEKTYLVRVAGKIDDDALTKIREGVHLSEGRTAGARILVNKRLRDQSTLTLTLREGMNREIRRSFAHVGYKVIDLRRTRIGPLSERGIKIGRWRELTREEVAALLAGHNESIDVREDARPGAGNRGGPRQRAFGRDDEPRGDRSGGPAGRAGARRPKVRSGWRVFDDRVHSRAEGERGGGRAARGPQASRGGDRRDERRRASPRGDRGRGDRADRSPQAGQPGHPGRIGPAGPRGRPAHGAPRRAGGGPGAHKRRMNSPRSGRAMRGAGHGAGHGGPPSGRAPFGKRSGKPAPRGANRRG